MKTTERWMRRYETEAQAVDAARRYSAADQKREYTVLESPHQESPAAGRWVVDTDGGFLRAWERRVCSFVAGKTVELE